MQINLVGANELVTTFCFDIIKFLLFTLITDHLNGGNDDKNGRALSGLFVILFLPRRPISSAVA